MSIDPFVSAPYFFVLFLSFATVKMATSPIFFALSGVFRERFHCWSPCKQESLKRTILSSFVIPFWM